MGRTNRTISALSVGIERVALDVGRKVHRQHSAFATASTAAQGARLGT
jgi:hypothetical protein